jgi:nucleoside-diphosphate-sugar epimerase
LVDRLIARGERVKALVRKTSKVDHLREMGAELVLGDLRNPETLDLAMHGCDIIFHLAAAPDYAPEKVAWSTNHLGAINMLEAALKRKVQRFVHCSTVGVIGFADEAPLDERAPYDPSPCSPYAKSKCEGEKKALAYYRKGLAVTVVRPSQVYGPRSTGTMGQAFIQAQKGSLPLIAGGRALLQPIHVQDLADAMILAMETDMAVGEVYNIAGDTILSFKELFSIIADAFGVDPPKRNLSRRTLWALAYLTEMRNRIFGGSPPMITRFRVQCATKNMTYDMAKAQEELGFNPTIEIREGVRRTAEWYNSINL